MAQLNFGDIIYVDRGPYKHFGIYSGNNKVIHYVKENGKFFEGIVSETSVSRFLNGDDTIYIFDFERELLNTIDKADNIFSVILAGYKMFNYKIYSAEETVQRARSCIGTGGYSLIFHNCEHFAVWCKTGLEDSSQVSEIVSAIANFAIKTKFRI